MNDIIQKMIFDQYEKVETYDLKISFSAPLLEQRVLGELRSFPGVRQLEAMAEVPVTLQNKWLKKDVQLLGIAENSGLYHILDKNGREVAPPKDGLLLSERLAMLLDAEPGTMLNVESILHGSDSWESKKLPVVGIIPQYLGLNAYMDLHALQDFLKEDGLTTSVMLSMDEGSIPRLQEEYRQSNLISNMDERGERIRKLNEDDGVFRQHDLSLCPDRDNSRFFHYLYIVDYYNIGAQQGAGVDDGPGDDAARGALRGNI
jgi:putative ABC transport system permease protein